MNAKSYILFDLDGTLTDPMVGITKSVQYALKSYGIHEPDLKRLTPFIGPPLKDSFMKYYGFRRSRPKRPLAVTGNTLPSRGSLKTGCTRASPNC